MNEKSEIKQEIAEIKLPEGCFCGHNCADGCIYWNPGNRDEHGRQYCSWYGTYYYPRDRQGCLSFKDHL